MSVQVSISLQNFRNNFSHLIARCKQEVSFLPSLKANAYGHGLKECVSALSSLAHGDKKRLYGVGLARVSEILELRHAGLLDKVVLYSHATSAELTTLFSTQLPHDLHGVASVRKGVEFFVGSERYLHEIVALARRFNSEYKLRIHLKCDLGMGRLGVMPEQFMQLYHAAHAMKDVVVVGVCGHFSATDDETVRNQSNIFSTVLEQLGEEKNSLLIHGANSGSALWAEETHHSMVRPGIILYGAHPQPMRELPPMVSLCPVMKVSSRVAAVKKVPKNHGISYLSTYVTERETHIAVVNAGYGDGIPIGFSNRAQVRIKGKNYPIVGRVCMDMLMVDLGFHADGIVPNDEVVFWGDTGLCVDEQALRANTISYELLCSVGNNCRVEKVFVE